MFIQDKVVYGVIFDILKKKSLFHKFTFKSENSHFLLDTYWKIHYPVFIYRVKVLEKLEKLKTTFATEIHVFHISL